MWRQWRQLHSCPADCGLDRVRHQACSCEFNTPWLVKLGVDWCFLKLRRIRMLPLLERKPLHGIGDPLQQHGSERPTQWSGGDPKNTPGGSHHVRLWEEHDHFCWLCLHGVPFVSCCLRALHYFYTQCQLWDLEINIVAAVATDVAVTERSVACHCRVKACHSPADMNCSKTSSWAWAPSWWEWSWWMAPCPCLTTAACLLTRLWWWTWVSTPAWIKLK